MAWGTEGNTENHKIIVSVLAILSKVEHTDSLWPRNYLENSCVCIEDT